MGVIVFRRAQLVGCTSEIVGYKAGLALSRTDLARLTDGQVHEGWWDGDEIRLRADAFAELIEFLLYTFGIIPNPIVKHPGVVLIEKYSSNPKDWATLS